MLATRTAAGQKNGHAHRHPTGLLTQTKKIKIISRSSLKQAVIEQFQLKPFSLDRKDAERCAAHFMKEV